MLTQLSAVCVSVVRSTECSFFDLFSLLLSVYTLYSAEIAQAQKT